MSKVNLDKDKFREWLESKAEGEIIGRIIFGSQCPIAQYLNDQFQLGNYDWWIVTTSSFYPFHYDSEGYRDFCSLPEWAKTFVKEIDSSVGLLFKQVTKERCLEVL